MATAVITDKKFSTKSIESSDYSRFKIIPDNRLTRIEEVLPFRVKFINIGIEGYGPSNPPPIPLQVIGFSNYIL